MIYLIFKCLGNEIAFSLKTKLLSLTSLRTPKREAICYSFTNHEIAAVAMTEKMKIVVTRRTKFIF